MDQEEIIVKIPIDKYDEIYEAWLVQNNIYVDSYNIYKKTVLFDESLGLRMDRNIQDSDHEDYRFKIVDGSKFIIAQLKYLF
jgi:hypothetical protein